MLKRLGLFFIFLTAGHNLAETIDDHVIVYQDPKFYAAFPSIVQRPNGELLAAFRRAPDRRKFSEGVTHTDANSYLVLVRSTDGGKSWTKEPELIYAHPFGGSQDPCMVQLRDGTLLLSSYAWARISDAGIKGLKKPFAHHGNYAFLGGFLLRSRDGAASWDSPILPPPTKGEGSYDIFGNFIPAYNRGAMSQGPDGHLYWVVASAGADSPTHTANHLLISDDQGQNWRYSSVVAQDNKVAFNEASIYVTPKQDLVAFLRSENSGDQTWISRSSDGGRSFQWKSAGFQGHPHHALRLPDDRVLLVYGFRHPPFGIRARILNAECSNIAGSKELILRADGGNGDLGYPWATLVGKDRALVVYYFNVSDGTRHIGGTFLNLNTTESSRSRSF